MAPSTALTKRVAIIDLGSNSARLIVVQYQPGYAFRLTDQISRRVRLSEGQSADGALQPAAMTRAIETVRMFRAFCAAHGIKSIIPVATAAVRYATNQADFLARLKTASGMKFRVLSGEEEAYYGVVGVINGLGLPAGLVMDVGGGSGEFSQVRRGRFAKGETTPLGAVRLTEQFFDSESDQVKASEFIKLRQHVDSTLAEIDWMALGDGERFVGLGGTVRALARMDRESRQYPLGLQNGYVLERARLDNLLERLAALPVSERARKVPGLQSDRADIILAGAVVVSRALHLAGADSLTVCGHGLREGLFFEIFMGKASQPVLPRLREFSVRNLARLYDYQEDHAQHVTRLALSLFDQLSGRHGYGASERDCLWAAGQLHDIGSVVDYYDHHRHSSYIILSAGLPGYTHRETALIAALCQWHRKGRPSLEFFRAVPEPGDLERMERLAALLRLAEYLDRSRTQAVAGLTVTSAKSKHVRVKVRVRARADARVEIWEAQRNTDLFEQAFGCKLTITRA